MKSFSNSPSDKFVLESLLTLAFSSKQQPDLNLFTTQSVQPLYRFDRIVIGLVTVEKRIDQAAYKIIKLYTHNVRSSFTIGTTHSSDLHSHFRQGKKLPEKGTCYEKAHVSAFNAQRCMIIHPFESEPHLLQICSFYIVGTKGC